MWEYKKRSLSAPWETPDITFKRRWRRRTEIIYNSLHYFNSKFINTLRLIAYTFSLVQQPNVGQGRLVYEFSRSHTMTHHSR